MANLIRDKLYQVAIGGRWNFHFIHAENEEDLIRFLARNYSDKNMIFGATEIRTDGTTQTVRIISHPLFENLYAQNEGLCPAKQLPVGVTMIRNRPWAVMLPTGAAEEGSSSQWDDFMAASKNDDQLGHYKHMATWCLDPVSLTCHIQGGRDPGDIHSAGFLSGTLRSSQIGYRPVLMPLDPETLKPAPSFFLGRNDGDLYRMGSLYLDGTVQHHPQVPTETGDIPKYVPGAKLHIGESSSNPEDRITWVKAGNVLIADRNLMNEISFEDLERMNLVYGPEHLQDKKLPFERLLAHAQEASAAVKPLPKKREVTVEK